MFILTDSFIVAIAAGFGLLIGSFLNVVIWRVPRGVSIVSPPSACPGCGAEIRSRDNVPVVSWVALKGRCRDCAKPISVRYPLVEATTGLFFAVVVWHFGVSWATFAYLYLAAISIALALIDLDTQRLPNAIVMPSYPVSLVLLAVASLGADDWGAFFRAVLAGAGLYAFYFALMVAVPRGMGFGDVKLAGILGAYLGWVGWGAFAVGAFAAPVLGGLFAVALLLTGRAGRKSGIPFGPWLLLGAWLGIAWGQQMWDGYLGIFA